MCLVPIEPQPGRLAGRAVDSRIRHLARPGIRVTSSVRETPVEATVTLRTETVGAERRDANRPLEGDEAETAFKEKTIEMMGTREEAEVHKEARVVGEVYAPPMAH
ncbi:DUF2382 domain-containing protein [Cereibacter azotoformans]|uniref:Uncharacterized protein DUF2382 n=1 Tax=Cereibacter azotoformans TaxID=43057 RepID=A0A2T5JHA8_9RHOB|nr:DUF2382 domain-containing protein [Cereibacter sphaeroides]PTR05131.1 uncharacterized protein DUF2382 [Cereibacter azotoformans]